MGWKVGLGTVALVLPAPAFFGWECDGAPPSSTADGEDPHHAGLEQRPEQRPTGGTMGSCSSAGDRQNVVMP